MCIDNLLLILALHCAQASCGAVYCNRSCLWVCDRAGGRLGVRCPNLTTARARCLRLSERFFHYKCIVTQMHCESVFTIKGWRPGGRLKATQWELCQCSVVYTVPIPNLNPILTPNGRLVDWCLTALSAQTGYIAYIMP